MLENGDIVAVFGVFLGWKIRGKKNKFRKKRPGQNRV